MEQKRVLIVDDEEMHLYTAKGLLENNRIKVTTHKGSFGATNRVKEVEPDLILLDVNMPALSGENLVTLIKPYCEKSKTPIFFYSSNDEAILRELAVKYGVAGYICKGDVYALRGKVHDCLKL